MPNQGYSYYCTQRELVTDGKQRPPAGMGPRRRWTAAVRSAINRRRPAVRLPRCWLTFWRASHRHRVARSGRRATIIRCSALRDGRRRREVDHHPRGPLPPPPTTRAARHASCRHHTARPSPLRTGGAAPAVQRCRPARSDQSESAAGCSTAGSHARKPEAGTGCARRGASCRRRKGVGRPGQKSLFCLLGAARLAAHLPCR
jgi:hypothetical protein